MRRDAPPEIRVKRGLVMAALLQLDIKSQIILELCLVALERLAYLGIIGDSLVPLRGLP